MHTFFIASTLVLAADALRKPSGPTANTTLEAAGRRADPICDASPRTAREDRPEADDTIENSLSRTIEVSEDVVVTHWANRAGNNLAQLERALVVAARLGKKRVLLPSPDSIKCGGYPNQCGMQITAILDLPRAITLQPEPSLRDEGCDGETTKIGFGGAGCNFTITAGAMLLQKYALPFLNAEAREGMRPYLNADRDLVIHLRGGDIMWQQRNGNHLQPPCSFYKTLINRGLPDGTAYVKIRVVAEREHQNPCVKVLERDFPDRFVLQSDSVAKDAGSILAARHLIAGRSTFPQQLAKLSSQLRRVWLPECFEWHFQGWTTDCMRGVESYVYPLKGMEKGHKDAKTYSEMCDWMVKDAAPLPAPIAPCQAPHAR
mmetsp:Transcript_110266/g.312035  ORF Transcript_110266/g.312035 Transcript_110266/m.312035 type:complete len:375 (-) Transcript_110266:184-1308(-)